MKVNKKRRLFIFLFIPLVSSCRPPVPVAPLPLQTIAILPFDNESNDLNAPDILQQMVYEALKCSPYQVRPFEETNEFLKTKGIIDGGQLPVLDPTKMGKDLGVQALLYGDVENFDYVNIGFYKSRKVVLTLKLVEVATGATLWENTGNGSTSDMVFDTNKAGEGFLKGVAEQWVDKALKSPLQAEAEQATLQTLATLPGFNYHQARNFSRKKSYQN